MAEQKPNVDRPLALKEARGKVIALLNTMQPQIANALPRFITSEKMIRVAITAISKTPKLLECDQASLIGAIITASQLGLMPDGVLGEAYLIPFKLKGKMTCQFMIGYRGYISLALRSGQVKSIQSRAVKKSDVFSYEFGLEPKMQHVPKSGSDEIIYFYAVIQLTTGGTLFEVMSAEDVNFIRDKSKAYAYADKKEDTIWHQHYEEMGKKTVIRRLIKVAPLSPEMNRAVGLDELGDAGANQKTNIDLLSLPNLPTELQASGYNDMENELQQEEQERKNASVNTGTTATAKALELMNNKK